MYSYDNADVAETHLYKKLEVIDTREVDMATYGISTAILDNLDGGGAEIFIDSFGSAVTDIYCAIYLNGEPILEEQTRERQFYCGVTFGSLRPYTRDFR